MAQHSDTISCLAVLRDGRIVSGSWDNTVKLFNPQRGSVETIIRHKDWVTCLAVLPDGRIVSGSGDGTVQLYDPQGGRPETIIRHENWVICVAVLPDGRIVSGGPDRMLQLWDPQGGPPETIIRYGDEGRANCLAVLPDCRIVSGSRDGTVQLYDPQGGPPETILEISSGVTGLCTLPNGRLVAVGGQEIIVWDPKTRESLPGTSYEGIFCIAAGPGPNQITCGTANGLLILELSPWLWG
ncbi:MAG: WD40 repeat domain-containing protein [Planctomycetaceae bacterium]